MKENESSIDYRCLKCNNWVVVPDSNIKQLNNSNFMMASKICEYCGEHISFKVYRSV